MYKIIFFKNRGHCNRKCTLVTFCNFNNITILIIFSNCCSCTTAYKKTKYYEYDYNEIVGPTENLPLDDIQARPENYLNYKYADNTDDPGEKALKEIEELKAAIERGLTL